MNPARIRITATLPCSYGKFHFCGSETASSSPGYMEGAVAAAKSVSERF